MISFRDLIAQKSAASNAAKLYLRQLHTSKLAFSGSRSPKDSDITPVEQDTPDQDTPDFFGSGKGSNDGDIDPNKIALLQANKWIREEGEKYRDVVSGSTNYVGGRIPFPLNPTFKPKSPLPDSVKNSIYNDYLKGPARFTPRFLSIKYNISIKRVEAILKLKAIEAQMASDGKVLQKKFTAGMEDIMGVNSKNRPFREPISIPDYKVGKPLFRSVQESENFTPEDAATVLGRKPFDDIQDEVNEHSFYEINYPGLDKKFAPRKPLDYIKPTLSSSNSDSKDISPTPSKSLKVRNKESVVLSQDSRLSNKRWDFVFVDTTKGIHSKEKAIIIRKKDGTLVTADIAERQKRIDKVWPNKNYAA